MSLRYVHTCVRVLDPDRSVAFYEALGYERRGKLQFETGLPARPYLSRDGLGLTRSDKEPTTCPYKGTATYWSLPGIENAAWSYESPLPEAQAIAGLVAFDPSLVDVELSAGSGLRERR